MRFFIIIGATFLLAGCFGGGLPTSCTGMQCASPSPGASAVVVAMTAPTPATGSASSAGACTSGGQIVSVQVGIGCSASSPPPSASPASSGGSGAPYPGKKLVWDDEFSVPGAPDATQWLYETGNNGGWGNGELEYYTASLANAQVAGDGLNITVLHQPTNGFQYSSARMHTAQSWTYGRFDALIEQPAGTGIWPAFWMMPTPPTAYGGWPNSGELDIMEAVGWNPNVDYGTPHMAGAHAGGTTTVPGSATAFHLYSVEWDPTQIQWFADGVNFYTYVPKSTMDSTLWPFNKPFHIILNVAVGGAFGGQKGVDPSIYPQTMKVRYVRVYQ